MQPVCACLSLWQDVPPSVGVPFGIAQAEASLAGCAGPSTRGGGRGGGPGRGGGAKKRGPKGSAAKAKGEEEEVEEYDGPNVSPGCRCLHSQDLKRLLGGAVADKAGWSVPLSSVLGVTSSWGERGHQMSGVPVFEGTLCKTDCQATR